MDRLPTNDVDITFVLGNFDFHYSKTSESTFAVRNERVIPLTRYGYYFTDKKLEEESDLYLTKGLAIKESWKVKEGIYGAMRSLIHEIYEDSSKKKTQDTYYPWQRPNYYPKPPSGVKKQFDSEKVEDKSGKPLGIAEKYISEENTAKNAALFQNPAKYSDTAKKSALLLQQGLNLVGMKDKNGKPLKEDGFFGPKTQETFNRYWDKRFPTKPNYLSSIVETSSFPYPAISNYYTEPEEMCIRDRTGVVVCKTILQRTQNEMGNSIFVRWYFSLCLRNFRIDWYNLTWANKSRFSVAIMSIIGISHYLYFVRRTYFGYSF